MNGFLYKLFHNKYCGASFIFKNRAFILEAPLFN